MKKTWISVKIGMIDPTHQEQIGPAVWLFLYLLDRADWETGKVNGYTDQTAAEDLGMEKRTIRAHRSKLVDGQYISCRQRQRDQVVTIHNWTNPREYSGKVTNPPDVGAAEKGHPEQGDTTMTPKGDGQGDMQDDTQDDSGVSVSLIESSEVNGQKPKQDQDLAPIRIQTPEEKKTNWVQETSHKTASLVRYAMAHGRKDADWSKAPEHLREILIAFSSVWCDLYDRALLDGDRKKFIKQAEVLYARYGGDISQFILAAGGRHKKQNGLSINGPLSIDWAIREEIEDAIGAEKAAEKFADFWD